MSARHPPSSPPALAPGLYIVATPLGHARDITLRALDVLRDADMIYCEDTRHTGKLTRLYDIATPRRAYHEHNAEKMRPQILAQLADGAAIAMVSDAGTPLISDPGLPLVRAARAAGHSVIPVPGASAPIAALSAAGLPTDRFTFVGFLPAKGAARDKALAELVAVPMTLVFFESPQRLASLLAALAAWPGGREIIVARELTKAFEELVGGTADAVQAHFAAAPARGELVVLAGPPTAAAALGPAALEALLVEALADHSLRDAVQHVMAATGEKRKIVYQAALRVQRAQDGKNNNDTASDPQTPGRQAD